MKKLFILMVLIISIMITGCTKKGKDINKEEVVKRVYCDSCGEKSNEVTKFCSNCGKEAKWVSEKPDIVETSNYDESKNKEDNKGKESTDKKDQDKIEKGQCGNCELYFPKNELKKFYEGLLCNKCYKLPKNCKNGFKGVCEGCEECDPTNYGGFTGEEAIAIAEKHYGNGDTFYEYDTEAQYDDNKGTYYKVFVKSKSMQSEGGSGTLFTVLVYKDGTVIEN